MTFRAAEEDRDDPAKDGLIRQARAQFFATLLSGRAPIAFVGSGLSLIYGGVTWGEAVDTILDDALKALDSEWRLSTTPPVRKQLLFRLMQMLEAQRERKTGDYLSSADKYVALRLAEDAFRLAAADKSPSARANAPTVQSMFAELARDNSKAISQILARRIFGRSGNWRQRSVVNEVLQKTLAGKDIQSVRDKLYNLAILNSDLFASIPEIHELSQELERVLPAYKELPLQIDKPYIFAPIIACLSDDNRRRLLADIVQQAELMDTSGGNVTAREPPPRPSLDPLRHLHELFGISRYITLNYDFEIENLVMVRDLGIQKKPPAGRRVYGFDSAIDDGLLDREQPDFGVSRRLPDGRIARSDIYRPGSAARLFELGLNSPDQSFHILHLHGRADDPRSMVTKDEDLNRVYRRSSSNVESLNQALDLALTANPVLFVGTGMSETEITRGLRQLASEIDRDPDSAAFWIEASSQSGLAPWRKAISQYLQFGLRILPYGDESRGDEHSLPAHLVTVRAIKEKIGQLRKACVSTKNGRSRGNKRRRAPQVLDYTALKLSGGLYSKYLQGEDVVLRWIVDRLNERDTAGTEWPATNIDTKEHFLDAVEEFLSYLESKLYSAAFVDELEKLANDLGNHKTRLDRLKPPRDYDILRRQDPVKTRHSANVATTFVTVPDILSTGETRIHMLAMGEGKGQLCRQLGLAYNAANPQSQHCSISFCHGLEVDSAITVMRHFLAQTLVEPAVPQLPFPTENEVKRLLHDRIVAICEMVGTYEDSVPPPSPAQDRILFLSGVDRLFDDQGRPLSADIAELLRQLLCRHPMSKLTLEILATPIVAPWFALFMHGPAKSKLGSGVYKRGPALTNQLGVWIGAEVQTERREGLAGHLVAQIEHSIKHAALVYWEHLTPFIEERLKIAKGARAEPRSPSTSYTRKVNALVRLALDNWVELHPGGSSSPDWIERQRTTNLDHAILWSLAVIGAPTTAEALAHAHRVRAAIGDGPTSAEILKRVQVRLTHLRDFGLVLKFEANASSISLFAEYVPHRAVQGILRDFFGIPLGDALLSNSYQPTLAASLPTDIMLPEDDVRRELKRLTARLIGAWKDISLVGQADDLVDQLKMVEELKLAGGSALDASFSSTAEDLRTVRRAAAMSLSHVSDCLRAAANVARGFFSVASLVTADNQPVDDPNGLGEYESHKRRLAKIFSAAREGGAAEADGKAAASKLGRAVYAAFDGLNGKVNWQAPLYGGDIIWLHNERAVLSLIQGDLYEARFSFRQAMRSLDEYKGTSRGHYRRRIEVNRSLYLIERGRIGQASFILRQVQAETKEPQEYIAYEFHLLGSLATAYLAMCDHLQGHLPAADRGYSAALDVLEPGKFLRATAIFRMRRAAVRFRRGLEQEAGTDIRAAVYAAESGRQMDVLWRARVSAVALSQESDAAAVSTLRQALDFGSRLANHRVRLDAFVQLGAIAERLDDPISATRHYADAMKVATRYGFNLRRSSLRISMGRNMVHRGDRAGLYLIQRGIRLADRQGYQGAVEQGQQCLVDLEKSNLVSADDIARHRG